jgi:diketogulonate reductase-like aldo/keto reductase
MEYRIFGRTGEKLSVIGMGTYYGRMHHTAFAHDPVDPEKVAGLRRGIELGMNLIDTAEVYHTEGIVAQAASGMKRDELFIATKVWTNHLHYDDVRKAAEGSLTKLRTSYIDLYQIHWPSSSIPIKETMRAMERLVQLGKVRYIGVSNFSAEQVEEARNSMSRNDLVSNQVEYSLVRREIEDKLIPACSKDGMAILAYRPLAGGYLSSPRGQVKAVMDKISTKYGGKTYAQISLNWLLRKSELVFPIPRISKVPRAEEDTGAAGWSLNDDDILQLERAVTTFI